MARSPQYEHISSRLPVGVPCTVAILLLALADVAGASAVSVRVHLSRQPPTEVTEGQAVVIVGRVPHAPAGSVVELQLRSLSARWHALRSARPHAGSFTFTWRPHRAAAGISVSVRVVVRRHGVTLAGTSPAQVLIGFAPRYCAAPNVPTSLPPGDGAIVGGLYLSGGPAPGIYNCYATAYAVTLTAASGAVLLTQQVAAGQSYVLVAPAGSYTLKGSENLCTGHATVLAGQVTKSDTVCDVP